MAEFDILPTEDIYSYVYSQLNFDVEEIIKQGQQEEGRALAKKNKQSSSKTGEQE